MADNGHCKVKQTEEKECQSVAVFKQNIVNSNAKESVQQFYGVEYWSCQGIAKELSETELYKDHIRRR